MDEKLPTQAVPENDNLKGAPDGTDQSDVPADYLKATDDKDRRLPGESKEFHGGQSVPGYHGPQQLGDQVVEPGGNPNAGTKH